MEESATLVVDLLNMGDDTPRRVLHTNFLKGWGGQSNRILTECKGLAERGWNILISAPPGSELIKRARAEGLAVDESVTYRGGLRVQAIRDVFAMRSLLRRFRPDIVHLHGGRDSWAFAGALKLGAGIPRPAVVRTKHNVFPLSDNFFNRWQWGKLFDSLIVLANAGAEQLRAKPYIDPSRIEIIPSAIDADRFRIGAEVRQKMRDVLGFAASDEVIAMTGRLRPEKGHDVLLAAIPAIISKRPNARFLLLGAGSLQGELAETLQRAALTNHVRLAGFRTDIPECLAAADLYAQPSRSEGLGTSVLEAAAAGLPIVASNTGGIPDIIRHEETGLLVPVGDAVALAAAILRLLGDNALRQLLGTAARDHVKQRFSIDSLVSATERTYRSILEPR